MAKKIRVFEGFAGYGGDPLGIRKPNENIPNYEYKVIAYKVITRTRNQTCLWKII